MALDVDIDWLAISDEKKFPWLRPSGFLRYMAHTDTVSKLCGEVPHHEMESICLQFWRNFALEWPSHQIFEASRQNALSLSRTIPAYLFGDEGRSYKKSGIMCISFQGPIGRGTRHFLQRPSPKNMKAVQKLNLKGHSLNSRFLIAAMPKQFYAKNPEVYKQLFDEIVDDLLSLQNEGFLWHGERWFLQILGLKGDLPFLAKTAGLTRHWLRMARKDSAKDPFGVCFYCEAGKANIPFEDTNDNCRWATVPCSPPWDTAPSFLKLHHVADSPETFLKTDLFHNVHGGVAKGFCASSLAEILVLVMPRGSRDAKCKELDTRLRSWARRCGRRLPHSGGFSWERISLTSYQVCPDAAWSKHSDTTVYMRFIEYLLSKEPEAIEADETDTLRSILTACRALNQCLALLYSSGLWLTSEEAVSAGTKGRCFLRTFALLAWQCHNRGALRFPLHAKLHMVDHCMRQLVKKGHKNRFVLNPLAESNQMDEDA